MNPKPGIKNLKKDKKKHLMSQKKWEHTHPKKNKMCCLHFIHSSPQLVDFLAKDTKPLCLELLYLGDGHPLTRLKTRWNIGENPRNPRNPNVAPEKIHLC